MLVEISGGQLVLADVPIASAVIIKANNHVNNVTSLVIGDLYGPFYHYIIYKRKARSVGQLTKRL